MGQAEIEDTGPLTKKRMETVDEEFLGASLDFIDRANKDKKPFFVWFNSTRMHIFTHLKKESEGMTGLGIYPDGMVEHDGHVGQLLKKLDDLGIADNTIVMYTTDNGAEASRWPDGGTTPFRSEKNTQLGGRLARARDGALARRDQAAHRDQRHLFLRGLAAHAGWRPPASRTSRRNSSTVTTPPARPSRSISTASTSTILLAGGPTSAMRSSTGPTTATSRGSATINGRWSSSSRQHEGLRVWQEPLVPLSAPLLVNLRTDPFEKADLESGEYENWYVERMFVMAPAQAFVARELQTFKDFPPRQKPGSFSVGDALDKLLNAEHSSN